MYRASVPVKGCTLPLYIYIFGPGSVAGVATGYGLDGHGIESRWGRDFLHLSSPEAQPASCTMDTGSFSGEGRLGRDADPSPPSNAVVMKE